ncbi:MAG TPA: 4-alpha-glucanotransferase, partial [Miltoncostaeaceae bacterium]|nr:4-alpha-glucanotransferase [Miltoncostaeaceae bacterium]
DGDGARPAAGRAAGVLLHPTSLPGGRLGEEAFRFVDRLAEAGQTVWQILPLTPPDENMSPYRSASAFAGWPGLLAEPDAPVSADEADACRRAQAYWIGDWEAHAGPGAVEDQVRFAREWGALRAHARARGVRIMGDIPIFVAAGSADHRAHPGLFREGLVTGVPPDMFSETGQLWGNPVYDWPAMRRDGYRWWVERFRRALELHDMVRIDHFRGFVAGWEVPSTEDTAVNGRWRRGPGMALFRAVEQELGRLPLIAEDLGVITPPVSRLRETLGIPGMTVLHFAFDGGADNPYHPDRHRTDTVVYTGTHDNATTAGWWQDASPDARAAVDAAAAARGIDEPDPVWRMIRLAHASPGRLAVVPMQDLLGLDDRARMNTPGTAEGNWTWRMDAGAFDDALVARLRALTEAAGRAPAGDGDARAPGGRRAA